MVSGLLEKHGGVQGIVAQTEQQGLGGTVKSWGGTDANLPICPAQVHQAFGADAIAALAAKLGVHHRISHRSLHRRCRRRSIS